MFSELPSIQDARTGIQDEILERFEEMQRLIGEQSQHQTPEEAEPASSDDSWYIASLLSYVNLQQLIEATWLKPPQIDRHELKT